MDEHMLARQSGAWIRETMERYALSANSLATTAGLPSERIAQLASGADYPSPDEVNVIARAVARVPALAGVRPIASDIGSPWPPGTTPPASGRSSRTAIHGPRSNAAHRPTPAGPPCAGRRATKAKPPAAARPRRSPREPG